MCWLVARRSFDFLLPPLLYFFPPASPQLISLFFPPPLMATILFSCLTDIFLSPTRHPLKEASNFSVFFPLLSFFPNRVPAPFIRKKSWFLFPALPCPFFPFSVITLLFHSKCSPNSTEDPKVRKRRLNFFPLPVLPFTFVQLPSSFRLLSLPFFRVEKFFAKLESSFAVFPITKHFLYFSRKVVDSIDRFFLS